jgi:hypothetical protein
MLMVLTTYWPLAVMPAVAVREDGSSAQEENAAGQAGDAPGAGGGGGKDPLIAALIQKLPKPGGEWSTDDRVTWLQMIAMAFQMAYGATEPIEIKKKSAS